MFSLNTPQSHYFKSVWKIPGTDWTISGHSRALERTGFYIHELCVMLDAGVDLPTNSGGRPAAIMVTHGHIDHMNALPMLLRHSHEDCPVHILAPKPILHRIRQFARLSYAVKVNDGEELPEEYQPPPESDRISDGEVFQDEFQVWHGVNSDTERVLRVGKKSKTDLSIRTLQLFHGRCTSIGYMLTIPVATKTKVRQDLVGSTKQETAANVKAARARGEEINENCLIPEQPKLAFVLDTTVEALMPEKSPTASLILQCPVIMMECTYLEDAKEEEAKKRGHVWWGGLLPFVQAAGRGKTWALVHFSLRYSDGNILDFFEDAEASRVRLVKGQDPARPPDLVLWLDSGPKELWVDSFL
jgi:ribonuclease Z